MSPLAIGFVIMWVGFFIGAFWLMLSTNASNSDIQGAEGDP